MKIWKLEQLKQQTNVDEMVLAKAEEILKVLNVHYGDDRLVSDLGGYILLDIEEIHTFITQHSSLIPEYIESFEGRDSNQYVEVIALVLELIMEGLSQGEAIHRVADRLGLDPEEIKRWM